MVKKSKDQNVIRASIKFNGVLKTKGNDENKSNDVNAKD